MGIPHLVKIGLLGRVGRFVSTDGRRYDRAVDVVCRTERGLEVGNVMCALEEHVDSEKSDGKLLRRMTPEDHLIVGRIDRFRDRAYTACSKLLDDAGMKAVLVDVEHLFDGQSLYFYFLGDVPDQVHDLTDSLAEAYEKNVRFRKFTETMASGCGPDCGTDAAKCSSGGCGSCAVSGSCKK